MAERGTGPPEISPKTLQEFRVLDLARITAMPSLFDARLRGLRATVSFLKSFCDEISRPIWKGSREDIEYIPTQIFTEYIKHLYRDRAGKGVDGILYKSVVMTFPPKTVTP